ncbi:hypothetical protein N2152v2_006387 [Parachlorella kessleri]
MVQVLDPSSIWVQLGSFFFLASALFHDLLVIRVCLLLAYVWMLTAAATGYPIWPGIANPGVIGVDGIVWACLNLFFHGLALLSLLWDERRITFKDPDAQSLWLFFYRRSGMPKVEFLQTWKRCKLVRYKKGATVLSKRESERRLILMVEGLATYKVELAEGAPTVGNHAPASTGTLYSGSAFDKALLNVLGVFLGFEKDVRNSCVVVAETDCLVASWDLVDLNYLATGAGPAVSAFWRNWALCQVGMEFPLPERGNTLYNARNLPEPPGVLQGTARSSDFTDPLEELEDPPTTWFTWLTWLPSKFGPFVPPGIRHSGLPTTGTMAHHRVMSILKATGHEDVSDQEMLRLMRTPPNSFWKKLGLTGMVAKLARLSATSTDGHELSAYMKRRSMGEEKC